MALRRGRSATSHRANELENDPVVMESQGVGSDIPPNDVQFTSPMLPFFVLHKGTNENLRKKPRGLNRKIDMIQFEPGDGDSQDSGFVLSFDGHQRMDAFEFVWSKIESTIKHVLRNINTPIFIEIHLWVRQSFEEIRSYGTPTLPVAARSLPVATDAYCKQLFTGLVLTENLEFVDISVPFEELGIYLKFNDCHVAKLSPLDFSAKNGIGGCLRTLSKQLLNVTSDGVKLSTLASWYAQQENDCKPVVVIIDDMNQCCASVLSEFIQLLSDWVIRIPVILIMGSPGPSRNILPSIAMSRLRCDSFILGSPVVRMDAIFKSIIENPWYGFSSCHGVAVLMKKHFLRHDGTLISFIRALKIACVQHFMTEPLSSIIKWMNFKDKNESRIPETKNEIAADKLLESKRLQKCFSAVLLALYGDARKRNQVDMVEFQKYLNCSCCSKRGIDMLPSMPDTSILFMIGEEYGESINLHDWYQSFKSIIERKQKLTKKRKSVAETHDQSEASLQARFCMAVKELQITGLLGMPNKRRPDFVHRIAFGPPS